MKVWIVFIGETLPMDKDTRKWRYGMLADALVERGHNVVRWAPTFNHAYKEQRSDSSIEYKVSDYYTIRLVRSMSYSRNISLKRLFSYKVFSALLAREFNSFPEEPDIIIAGLPAPEVCNVVVDYAKKKHIPVIIDIRDLWPDIFFRNFQAWFQKIILYTFNVFFYDVGKILKSANSLIAVSDEYLKWGIKKSGRDKLLDKDKVFPIGYEMCVGVHDHDQICKWLSDNGVLFDKFICCYFGQLESTYDIETILRSASYIKDKCNQVQFIVCGKGSKNKIVEEFATNSANVIYLGWVSFQVIKVIMDKSSVGLATYAKGAPQSLPNKPFEYLAGGLPVISSLKGEFADLIENNKCGISYCSGDADQLGQAILYLFQNPEQRSIMSKNASKLFREKFSSKKIYPSLVDHMENIAVHL